MNNRTRPGKSFAFGAALAILWSVSSAAENWPMWRGPRGDGVSKERDLPLQWTSSQHVVWRSALPGAGHSSPVIWDDLVFVASAMPEKQARLLLCLDRATGKILWQKTVLTSPLEPIHMLNSYASSTPATDGQRVYVSFLDRDQMYVAAYSLQGDRLWETRPGVFSSKHGFCTNPVPYRDRLIVNGDHDGPSYLACLDQKTGQTIWKVPRERSTRSYSTPVIERVGDQDQLLLNGSYHTTAYDPLTGRQLWICDGPSEQMVATVVRHGDLLFSLGGFPERHLLAIRLGGAGDVTRSRLVWRTHKSVPYVPSPVVVDGLLHVVSDEGIYTCFEPSTGAVKVRRRVGTHVSSSLAGAPGRVYITKDDGKTVVVDARSPEKDLATSDLGEDVFSTPAMSQGRLFIRGKQHLFCIGEQVSSTAQQP